jgi:hypothetical protein
VAWGVIPSLFEHKTYVVYSNRDFPDMTFDNYYFTAMTGRPVGDVSLLRASIVPAITVEQ